jgi:aminotransferase
MASIMLAVINPGDEVIVLEPFYENYGPDAILCEAKPVFHRLEPPEFRLDPARLEADVTPRTRAIILNTPNNPTGRVFDRQELEGVADICRRHDILAFTDEIYEHIYYDGEHIPLATLPDMRERTVTVSGASKTYSVTGWRLGTIVAPADLTDEIRKVHDFLTVGAPAPLQEGVAAAMNALGPEFYDELKQSYLAKREVLYEGLLEGGFRCSAPEGAYYIMADFSDLSDEDDDTFSRSLARDAGVIPVPGSSFFNVEAGDSTYVRFVFCKRIASLETASERLRAYARAGA